MGATLRCCVSDKNDMVNPENKKQRKKKNPTETSKSTFDSQQPIEQNKS